MKVCARKVNKIVRRKSDKAERGMNGSFYFFENFLFGSITEWKATMSTPHLKWLFLVQRSKTGTLGMNHNSAVYTLLVLISYDGPIRCQRKPSILCTKL